jgi:cytosine/adenosine deaminase-related metal-dependent hydrolase
VVDTLIEGGLVYTMDGGRRVIEDGAVAVEENMIVDVGGGEELQSKHSADRVIDASHCAVLPGFVGRASTGCSSP